MMCEYYSVKLSPVFFSITLILGVVVILCTIWFFYSTLCAKKSVRMVRKESLKDVKALKITSLISLGFYCLGFIWFFIGFVNCELNDTLFCFGAITSCMGTLSVLTVFSFRLNFTFNNTMFATSRNMKHYCIFVIVTIFVSDLINTTINLFNLNMQLAGAIGAITLFFLVLNGLLLLGIFITKLNNVINHCINNFGILTQPQLTALNKSVSIEFELQLNDDGTNGIHGGAASAAAPVAVESENVDNLRSLTRLISDMSKYTILVTISIISTTIFAILLTLFGVIIDPDNIGLIIMFFLIDTFVNTICLILQFEISKKYYFLICGKSHALCEDRYTQRTNKKNLKHDHDTSDTVSYKLARLETGEIGLLQEHDGSGQSNSNAHGVTGDAVIQAQIEEIDQDIINQPAMIAPASVDSVKGIHMHTNDIMLVAQKSASLQGNYN